MLGNAIRSQTWKAGAAALAAASICYALICAVSSRFNLTPVDDAFISLRYAANWAGGDGLSFNPGERVEGYTNFLLVLLETIAIRCGVDPIQFMTNVGRCSLACLAGVLAVFISRCVLPGRNLLSLAAAIVIALNPVLVCWAHSGLESCLFALLVLLSVVLIINPAGKARATLSAICLILAAMTRPEAVALFPVMCVVVYLNNRAAPNDKDEPRASARAVTQGILGNVSSVHRCHDPYDAGPLHHGRGSECDALLPEEPQHRSIRALVCFVGVFIVGFSVYFTVRWLYYGYPFPNTFYAKLDYGSLQLLKRGLIYVCDFARATPLLSLMVLATVAILRSAPGWVRAFMLLAGVELLVVVYEGGDHFAMYRFMVPVIPLVSVAAIYLCVELARRYGLSEHRASLTILAGVVGIGVSNLMITRQPIRREGEPSTQLKEFVSECAHARDWAEIGRWFQGHAAPDASVCTIAIGAVGYYSGLRIVDPHGIVDETIAHKPADIGSGYPGHEKYDVDYVLSQRPDYLLLVHILTPRPVAEGALDLMVWGQFNREVLNHPTLQEKYRYEVVRIGDRYLNLFARRDLPPLLEG
jgi:arabinofuranosyltransferase